VGTFVGISLTLVATYFSLQAGAAVITFVNADLGPSDNASLYSIVFSMCQPISILIFGRLSDRFGRREFAIGANLIGIVGGIVCATATNMNMLIGGSALLGLASGPPACYPLLTGELLSNKYKMLGTMVVVVPNVIATGFAPYIGQRLIYVASWRWIFYIYLMMIGTRSETISTFSILINAVPGTVCYTIWYHPPSFVQLHGKAPKRMNELKRTDWAGIFLLIAGLCLLILGVSWGGQPYPWNSARVLGPLISGILLCVIFVLYEIYGHPELPIYDMRLFKDFRGFACINIISAVMGCMNLAMYVVWPSQVVKVYGTTATGWEQIAWLSTTFDFGLWGGIVIVGFLYNAVRHLRRQLLVGCIWTTIFLGTMVTVSRKSMGQGIALSFLSCFAIGWLEVVTMLIVQYLVPDKDLGVAFCKYHLSHAKLFLTIPGITSANRAIVGSVFTSIFVAILSNKLPGQMQEKLVPAVLDAGLPESSLPDLFAAVTNASQDALKAVPEMNTDRLLVANNAISDSYSGAYAYIYYTALALGIVAVLASLCLRDFDRYLTDHVSRRIHTRAEKNEDPLEVAQVVPHIASHSNSESVTDEKL
jgi:MFS family permease